MHACTHAHNACAKLGVHAVEADRLHIVKLLRGGTLHYCRTPGAGVVGRAAELGVQDQRGGQSARKAKVHQHHIRAAQPGLVHAQVHTEVACACRQHSVFRDSNRGESAMVVRSVLPSACTATILQPCLCFTNIDSSRRHAACKRCRHMHNRCTYSQRHDRADAPGLTSR